MSDRATKRADLGPLLSMGELMLWVAALAALLGLVGEVARGAMSEPSRGLVGVSVVFYVLYIAGSIRLFWVGPRTVVPATFLMGALLWTLALQSVGRVGMVRSIAIPCLIPFVMALVIRRLFPQLCSPVEETERAPDPSMVRSLLLRGRGFGTQSPGTKSATELEL